MTDLGLGGDDAEHERAQVLEQRLRPEAHAPERRVHVARAQLGLGAHRDRAAAQRGGDGGANNGTGGVRDAAEWCARAQLAQHAQYRALFEVREVERSE